MHGCLLSRGKKLEHNGISDRSIKITLTLLSVLFRDVVGSLSF
jgi:hypothetical protein